MEFVKKHYEKILLSAVLLGLAAAAVLLTFKVKSVQDDLDTLRGQVERKKVMPLKPQDLGVIETVIHRVQDPTPVRLCDNHNLFNPVRWDRKPDGKLIKIETGNEIGPNAMVITQIVPLKLILSYDGVIGAADTLRYQIGVTREAEKNVNLRRKTIQLTNKGEKKDLYTVKDIRGPVENPDAMVLELADTGEVVTVTRDKPYQRLEGYAADLRYEPENKTFKNQRADNPPLTFAGGTYIIVAIGENEVVLSARPSNQRTVIKYKAAP
ncbi:MAG: hypothetical protein ACYDH9_17465 [Limisphaerales bacterium]